MSAFLILLFFVFYLACDCDFSLLNPKSISLFLVLCMCEYSLILSPPRWLTSTPGSRDSWTLTFVAQTASKASLSHKKYHQAFCSKSVWAKYPLCESTRQRGRHNIYVTEHRRVGESLTWLWRVQATTEQSGRAFTFTSSKGCQHSVQQLLQPWDR